MINSSNDENPQDFKINSSNNTNLNRNVLKMHLINLIIISFLVGSNFLLGSYLRTDLENVLWRSDDVYHISVAHSFQKDQSFTIDFLGETDIFTHSIDDVIKDDPTISHEQSGKGPIYFILLGSFYKLLGTTPKDFYFHASLFANLTMSVFLVLFFFFIKNKFNLQIAFFSSILVLFIPMIESMSVRVIPDSALLLIFSLATLFFLEKKLKHYFLFGVFAGFAHLTHPFGIFVGMSYCFFLLFNKEFKGFLITFMSWNLVLLPWFIRNYYFYKDIGWGLWIPFSEKFSNIFSFLSNKTIVPISPTTDYVQHSVSNMAGLSPVQVFVTAFQTELSNVYYIDYLVIFLIIFSGFAFFNIDKLKLNKKYILIPLMGSSYLIVYYNPDDVFVSIAFFFVIPVIFFYLLYRYNRSSFVNPVSRLYKFIIFFTFVTLIAYYFTATLFIRVVPETREILFSILLLIPLALIGLDKLLRKGVESWLKKLKQSNGLPLTKFESYWSAYIKEKTILLKLLPIIMMVLILSPIVTEMTVGIISLKTLQYPTAPTPAQRLEEWVRNNVHDQSIASNFPEFMFLKTGLKSVPLPINANQIQFEEYLDHFGVSYIILYNSGMGLDTYGMSIDDYGEHFYENIKNWPINFFNYTIVYDDNHMYAIKAFDLIPSSDISHPILYLEKGVKFERLGELDKSTKIFDEIKNYKPNNVQITENICSRFVSIQKYNYAIDECSSILPIDKNDVVALKGLAISYAHTDQKDKTLQIVAQLNNLIKTEKNDMMLKPWGDLMNDLISYDKNYSKPVESLLYDAKISEENGQTKMANSLYNAISLVNGFTSESLKSQIRISVKLGNFDNALNLYDKLINFYNDEIKKSHLSIEISALQNSMIDTMNEKASLLTDLKKYDDANNVYEDVIRLDMFNENAHAKRAILLEKLGFPQLAAQEYDFVKRLQLKDSNK